jgi:hypothetical protein
MYSKIFVTVCAVFVGKTVGHAVKDDGFFIISRDAVDEFNLLLFFHSVVTRHKVV